MLYVQENIQKQIAQISNSVVPNNSTTLETTSPTPHLSNKMELLTTDMKIINTNTDLVSDESILTIVTTAEVIEITTTTTIEAIATIETTTAIIIITTSMKKVLNHIQTGVHKKEQSRLIYNQLGIVHKIITSNKSTAMITKKAMGITSELTWI